MPKIVTGQVAADGSEVINDNEFNSTRVDTGEYNVTFEPARTFRKTPVVVLTAADDDLAVGGKGVNRVVSLTANDAQGFSVGVVGGGSGERRDQAFNFVAIGRRRR